jgi:hypothetical protein
MEKQDPGEQDADFQDPLDHQHMDPVIGFLNSPVLRAV